jgi:hypothetical protein
LGRVDQESRHELRGTPTPSCRTLPCRKYLGIV